MYDLLLKLIQCHPVSNDTEAVNRLQETLENYLESNGVYCVTEDIDGRKTLYASTRHGKVQDILLNAHVDVVPPSYEGQFEPLEKDGYLFARGAGDCLGNVVCIVKLLIAMKDKASIGAIFTGDEEIGGVTSGAMIDRGYGASKMVIVMDSHQDYNITYAQKGIINVKLTARGTGGHAAYLVESDVNPIVKLLESYRKLHSIWKNPDSKSDWRDSMQPTIISGGCAVNQVPDIAEMNLNIRYTDENDMEHIVEKIRTATGLDVTVIDSCKPFSGDQETPELKLLLSCFKKHLSNKKPGFTRMCGATDARHFKRLEKPMCVIGVESHDPHSAKESLFLSSIDSYFEILKDFVIKYSTK